MENDYAHLRSLELLFSIPNDSKTWYLYQVLQESMIIPDEKHYTILYLCSSESSAIQHFKEIVSKLKENVRISSEKSDVIEANLQQHKIMFYNSSKCRLEKIYVMSIGKLKQGFDGYRISEVRFLD